VSWLKRLFGTTDAMEDALARAPEDEALVAPITKTTTSNPPAGWASPTTRDDGDAIVLEMPAPGLDPDTLAVEPEGSKLHLRASGKSADGHETISLDESLNFPEGSDLSRATADYDGDRLVVRIPKAGLKHTQSSA
jgi:HSP20 family molecular chaperone IbpA